jgi:hypothetical protein
LDYQYDFTTMSDSDLSNYHPKTLLSYSLDPETAKREKAQDEAYYAERDRRLDEKLGAYSPWIRNMAKIAVDKMEENRERCPKKYRPTLLSVPCRSHQAPKQRQSRAMTAIRHARTSARERHSSGNTRGAGVSCDAGGTSQSGDSSDGGSDQAEPSHPRSAKRLRSSRYKATVKIPSQPTNNQHYPWHIPGPWHMAEGGRAA